MNQKLTRLGKMVLQKIEENPEPLKQTDLVSALGINLRSVRYALKILQDANLVEKQPDLSDFRSHFYSSKN